MTEDTSALQNHSGTPLTVTNQLYASKCLSYGFDSGGDQGACGRRSGRLHRPPCDLGGEGYCTSAGTGYPWHAVKRFVRENQGLMRRMYGDQRHGQVLRAELEEEAAYESNKAETFSNPSYDDRKVYAKQELDLNMDNELFPRRDENEPRFLRDEDISNDDVLNTKFVYSEEPSISFKFAGLKSPHFRPTTHRTSTTTASTTLESTRTSSTTKTTTTANGDDILETTTENSNSDATTAELTTDTTTNQSGKGASFTSSTTEDIDALRENEESKPGTILFQDMDAQNKNKVHVNYQMKGVNACPVKEEVVAPFWANNTRGEVLALLNMYPYEQYVHWEKCTHEHRQMYCRDGCRCEQQYRLHRLLAYDPHNECRGVFSDWFRFPSCCVCKCYTIPPAEFRVTSRSPRTANSEQVPDQGSDQGSDHGLPDWYRRKNMAILSLGDHG